MQIKYRFPLIPDGLKENLKSISSAHISIGVTFRKRINFSVVSALHWHWKIWMHAYIHT
jgi:hypothetical protein